MKGPRFESAHPTTRPTASRPRRTEIAQKYGVNKSQFFVRPRLNVSYFAFNNDRPIFKGNLRLRKAINRAGHRHLEERRAVGVDQQLQLPHLRLQQGRVLHRQPELHGRPGCALPEVAD
jgi:hypothetical protein